MSYIKWNIFYTKQHHSENNLKKLFKDFFYKISVTIAFIKLRPNAVNVKNAKNDDTQNKKA